MGAKVRNQYQSNNVINILAFQELIIVVNIRKYFYLLDIICSVSFKLWFGLGVIIQPNNIIFVGFLFNLFLSNSEQTRFAFHNNQRLRLTITRVSQNEKLLTHILQFYVKAVLLLGGEFHGEKNFFVPE